MTNPRVSVIVSVYGEYDRTEVLELVLEAWTDQRARVEVVLSEQNHESRFDPVASAVGAEYVRTDPDTRDGVRKYNIGHVRNAGIAAATGEYVYVTDADVLPLSEDYLADRVADAADDPRTVHFRPDHYRLSQAAVGEFLAFVSEHGTDAVAVEDGEYCLATFESGRIGPRPGGEVRELIDGWTYVCTPEERDFLDSDRFDGDEEELILRPAVHWGGTFLPREQAVQVGGYCERFYDWGFEDDDFHHKLSGRYSLEPIGPVELVHFEHDRDYNDEQFASNERTFERRRARDVDSLIESDVESNDVFD